MCVAVFADVHAVIRLLVESFHPALDGPHNSVRFEQAYHLLVENQSEVELDNLWFCHPRNIMGQVAGGGPTLDFAPNSRIELLHDHIAFSTTGTDTAEVKVKYPSYHTRNYLVSLHFERRPGTLQAQALTGSGSVEEELWRLFNTNSGSFVDMELRHKVVPTFFKIALDTPIQPHSTGIVSFAFKGTLVKPIVTRTQVVSSGGQFTRQVFSLLSPMETWRQFQQVLRTEMSRELPQWHLANELQNQVANKFLKKRYLPVEELRIFVLSDEAFCLFDSHGSDDATFSGIDEIGKSGERNQAHIWKIEGHAETAEFRIVFTTGQFHA